MVKNMKRKEMKNENENTLAAMGIGAMIVFIALILVAAVASAVIIQTAEKLQQNAQTTGDQTQQQMASKIMPLSVVIQEENGVAGGAAVSPMPPIFSPLSMICVSTRGICANFSI